MREKKNPDASIGKQLHELRSYHRAYKKEFARDETMGVLVRSRDFTFRLRACPGRVRDAHPPPGAHRCAYSHARWPSQKSSDLKRTQ